MFREKLEEIDEVDLILGNNEKKEIVKYIEEYKKEKLIHIEDVMHQKKFINFETTIHTYKTRAAIKVQDGCDRFCSYCIIPYTRGRIRSRKISDVLDEVKELAKKGIKEIIITGIHIASYGKDFKEDIGLIDLLESINNINGIKRIRIGSLEPTIINPSFLERLYKLEKICHHFHLSLQSGCNETLKRMNRVYTTEEFENAVNLLRNTYKDVILTTDIIVGFPGETEEEFKQTYNFLKKIKFYKMHIFKYSRRSGTRADKMNNHIAPYVQEERSRRLIELSNNNQREYNRLFIGKVVEVLFEEKQGEYIKGHTQNYLVVVVREDNIEKYRNNLIMVKITGEKGEELVGQF